MAKKQKKKNIKKAFDWKKTGKWYVIGSILLTATISFFVIADEKSRIDHDLSVIGKGLSTVVQIHDPNCQYCRRLKSVVDSVKDDYIDKVHFKTANIKTEEGAAFAKQYSVPHVTLLFFNKKGRHVNTLQGVSSRDQVNDALSRLD